MALQIHTSLKPDKIFDFFRWDDNFFKVCPVSFCPVALVKKVLL